MQENAIGKADVDRSTCNHYIGVYMWLHCESMAWLACMGLQQYAFQFTWADMLAIYCNMVFLSAVAVVLDDYIRHLLWGEKIPHYKLF
nr:MAG TPA: hypothetical protein [Caudoviricetes sp.]